MTKPNRRTAIAQMSGGGLALCLPSLLSGCGGGGGKGDAKNELVKTDLVYDDSRDFIRQMNMGLESGNTVKVVSDGSAKVRRESAFYKFITGDRNIQNRSELAAEIHKMDTTEGRAQLAQVFDDELLSHQNANIRHKLPNGEVIEPTTVVLILVASFLVVGSGLVALQIISHGPIRAEIVVAFGDIRALFRFEPVKRN